MYQAYKVVDFHIHYSPYELVRDRLDDLEGPDDKKVRYLNQIPSSTIHAGICQWENHLAMMDRTGIDLAVISSAEGMRGDLEKCRIVNDALAEATKKYPGRIMGMGHTNPLAGDEGWEELQRAFSLGLEGVAIPSTIHSKTLDDPALWPFYEKLEKQGTFLFVHPALAVPSLGLEGFGSYDLYRTVGREFDLTLATLRLIFGGVLDQFPRLNIVMSHFGGTLSSLMGRIESYQDKRFWGLHDDPVHGKTAERPVREYLQKRLYFDMGGHFGDLKTIQAALMHIPPERLLFGSDFPQEIRDAGEIRSYLDHLNGLPLTVGQKAQMLGQNALNLVQP